MFHRKLLFAAAFAAPWLLAPDLAPARQANLETVSVDGGGSVSATLRINAVEDPDDNFATSDGGFLQERYEYSQGNTNVWFLGTSNGQAAAGLVSAEADAAADVISGPGDPYGEVEGGANCAKVLHIRVLQPPDAPPGNSTLALRGNAAVITEVNGGTGGVTTKNVLTDEVLVSVGMDSGNL